MNAIAIAPEQIEGFRSILVQDKIDQFDSADHYFSRRFQGINFDGARVLDVGSGRGLMTLYAAMRGAERVVSMEPEMDGSTGGTAMLQNQKLAGAQQGANQYTHGELPSHGLSNVAAAAVTAAQVEDGG